MEEGTVVKAYLQQSDGQLKPRPAVLLAQLPPFGDWLIAGISSQLRHYVAGFDVLIDEHHPDYHHSGLLKPGIIRLGFLGTIDSENLEGTLGYLSPSTFNELTDNLIKRLTEKI